MLKGYCAICGLSEHRRFYNYKTLGEFLGVSYATVKTWASLTKAYVEQAHPNPEVGWNQLMRAVNNLPTGAPLVLKVRSGKTAARGFRPLPPPIAPHRYAGCVIAAYAYDVIIGSEFNMAKYDAAINSRKQRAEALRRDASVVKGDRNG